jgi:glycosyltransferase involved in cell wall biosynthesis
LRSLAVGTPVVVSDLDNICAEVVADGTGEAFAVGDADAMGTVFAALAATEQTWTSRRAVARDAYERRYTPGRNIAKLIEIYTEVAAREGAAFDVR